MKRYFIDERIGCVAVRDKEGTDPEYPGLHPDTHGVVFYRSGTYETGTCPSCHQESRKGWSVSEDDIKEAKALCDKLNREETERQT